MCAFQYIIQLNIDLFEQNEIIEKNFPLAPKNQEEYCTLLSSLVKSLGIEVNELTNKEIAILYAMIKEN